MEQHSERTDPAENIVQFIDALRRRRSSQRIDRTVAEPTIAQEDYEPPPDAA